MSIYTAEVIAILQAVVFITQPAYDHIVICTDSQAAIKTPTPIQSGNPARGLATDIEFNMYSKQKYSVT